ncbi:hypothetical protein Cfor_11780, partial [Coptotermes formosanus]
MDETEFPPKAVPLRTVTKKGAKDVKFTNIERGDNETFCKLQEMYKQDLPAGSEIAMTDSGFINDHFFLEMIQHFHKGRSQGKGPLSFDGHSSDASLK